MKTTIKLLAVLVLVFSSLGFSASTALAAAPDNDTFNNATPVAFGFSQVLDTTEATTDSDDAQLNLFCATATDASVWYALPGSGKPVEIDTSQSNYSTIVMVGVGSQGNLDILGCGQGGATFNTEMGTTYYILVIDDQSDGAGNGGLLNISFREYQPPTLDFTVNRHGQVNPRTGIATISGSYTCTSAYHIQVSSTARQKVGRFTIVGYRGFWDWSTCDGTIYTWSTELHPENGKFAGGKLTIHTGVWLDSPLEDIWYEFEHTVQLSGSTK